MDEDTLHIILKIIHANASVSMLINKGYTPSQVALLIKDTKEEGYVIVQNDGSLGLTPYGLDTIAKYQERNKLKGGNYHILPQDNYRVTPIKKYDIIFPNKW